MSTRPLHTKCFALLWLCATICHPGRGADEQHMSDRERGFFAPKKSQREIPYLPTYVTGGNEARGASSSFIVGKCTKATSREQVTREKRGTAGSGWAGVDGEREIERRRRSWLR